MAAFAGDDAVHARRRALLGDGSMPPGWPRAKGPFVLLEQALGTLHIFDCAVHPLFVRLEGSYRRHLLSMRFGKFLQLPTQRVCLRLRFAPFCLQLSECLRALCLCGLERFA